MTFLELQRKFPNDQAVIDYYILARYNGTPACHLCGSIKVYKRHDNLKNMKCGDCNNTFSIFKDTIFEDSHTNLVKWMYAIHLMVNSKKGISGLQLKREIGVTYKTAWRMLRQIRKAMGNEDMKAFFDKTVEVDETYIGGKPRRGNNGNAGKGRENPGGRGTKKTPVVGIVDRENKKVHAKIATMDDKGRKVTGIQLLKIIETVVKSDANIITDDFGGYSILLKRGYMHSIIDHQTSYSKGPIHTNNIEGFWATLKRGILGIYHSVSVQHLQKYVNEFCFRYNNRDNSRIFDTVLIQSVMR